MAYSFFEMAEDVLKTAKAPFTFQQIWEAARPPRPLRGKPPVDAGRPLPSDTGRPPRRPGEGKSFDVRLPSDAAGEGTLAVPSNAYRTTRLTTNSPSALIGHPVARRRRQHPPCGLSHIASGPSE